MSSLSRLPLQDSKYSTNLANQNPVDVSAKPAPFSPERIFLKKTRLEMKSCSSKKPKVAQTFNKHLLRVNPALRRINKEHDNMLTSPPASKIKSVLEQRKSKAMVGTASGPKVAFEVACKSTSSFEAVASSDSLKNSHPNIYEKLSRIESELDDNVDDNESAPPSSVVMREHAYSLLSSPAASPSPSQGNSPELKNGGTSPFISTPQKNTKNANPNTQQFSTPSPVKMTMTDECESASPTSPLGSAKIDEILREIPIEENHHKEEGVVGELKSSNNVYIGAAVVAAIGALAYGIFNKR
ncbi:hypothetical protein ScalyP_jg3066 [Parmales sp. scaly parma]|nr:hypothetical protein ScalyP_jg3066 [Parmales sp. scaly parma]